MVRRVGLFLVIFSRIDSVSPTCVRRLLVATLLLLVDLSIHGCSDGSGPTGPDMTDPSSPGDNDPTAAFESKATPGSSAEAFLDDADFSLLRIEVDYMAGDEPTADAIDSLESKLREHLSKSNIEVQTPTSISAADNGPYSASDIRDLEAEHRAPLTRAESDTLWAYMLVVHGEFSQSNVLGVAYDNTSMAFFGKKIEEISGGLNQPSRQKVEATVFRHEVGHNLGLMNNGTPVQQDHHDEENGAHCTNDQCVTTTPSRRPTPLPISSTARSQSLRSSARRTWMPRVGRRDGSPGFTSFAPGSPAPHSEVRA